jgi:hypothetical protein
VATVEKFYVLGQAGSGRNYKILFYKHFNVLARLLLSVCHPGGGPTKGANMDMRKALVTAMAGCGLALGAGNAMAAPTLCSTIGTIGDWQTAVTCQQSDKLWTFTSFTSTTGDFLSAQVLFGNVGLSTHNMQIIGFDTTNNPNSWDVKYTIAVDLTISPDRRITDMFAGADNPGGGSSLVKTVSGDASFVLTVNNGAEDANSEKHGLSAVSLNIDEAFSVNADANLLSVSDTFTQRAIPLPGTLALLGMGLVALGSARRRRKS